MKKILLVFCFSLSALNAQPKMLLRGGDKPDFGEVLAGQVGSRRMVIANLGTETLRLSKISPECGCTAVFPTAADIAPRDSLSVRVEFNSKTYYGKITKAISITSNDPAQPAAEVNFTITVVSIVKTTPEYLIFYNVRIDSPMTVTMRVQNTSGATLKILGLTSDDRSLNARFAKRTLKKNESTDLVATYTPAKEGTIEGELNIKTNSRKQPTIPLKFIAVARK